MPHIRPKKKPTTPAPTAPLDADAMTKRTDKDATPHHPPYAEDWQGFFSRVVRQPDALSVADVERLIRFWTTYPGLWTEAYSRSREPKDQARVSLEHQYRAATRLLRAEAEKRAIDSESLEIAAGLCRHALVHHRLSRDRLMAGTATLPERLPVEVQWRDDEVAALTRAKALLARLSVVLSGKKKKRNRGGREPLSKAKQEHYEALLTGWEKARHAKSRKEFREDWNQMYDTHVTDKDLERAQTWKRMHSHRAKK